jgi:hypothetical protein
MTGPPELHREESGRAIDQGVETRGFAGLARVVVLAGREDACSERMSSHLPGSLAVTARAAELFGTAEQEGRF